jgi:pyruvate-formate lyase
MKTLPELCVEAHLADADHAGAALDFAEQFTDAFEQHTAADPVAREAATLAVQIPAILQPAKPEDVFAGRVRYGLVGLSPEPMGFGYYCNAVALRDLADRYPGHAERAGSLVDRWEGGTSLERVKAAWPDDVRRVLKYDNLHDDSTITVPLYRMAGTVLDYKRLLSRGLDGLEQDAAGSKFAHVVPVLRTAIDYYRATCDDTTIADTLRAVRHDRPTTLREATQLVWLYAIVSGTWNYGRLDDALGPFLLADLSAGRLTREEAVEQTCGLWRVMHAYTNQYNNRVFVGGRGRENEPAADEWALLAIEATRRLKLNQPQLSMRFYQGQDQRLWDAAVDAIGEGCTFPMLYNDDVNISAVAKAFGVEEGLAEQYTPFGCGEYVLGPSSVGTPNTTVNLLKALEVTLHGGIDAMTGERVDDHVPPVDSIESMDHLWAVYCGVVERQVAAAAVHQKLTYDVIGHDAPFGFLSLLTHDCLDRGRGIFEGGIRHLGGTTEAYGNINTSDSLLAIERLVFEEKRLTLGELVARLDNDEQEIRDTCLGVEKFGNDDGRADAMAARVHDHVCNAARTQAKNVGLDSFLVVVINNWANAFFGVHTAASADGRRSGEAMANAINPTSGADRNGVTAMLNSLAKLDPSIHAGAVQNLKFSKEWFGGMRPKFDALLRGYFAQGGTQAMITVTSRGDLEAAMREPDKWGHLMVRVGGFSIRFVDLPEISQREVLARTIH